MPRLLFEKTENAVWISHLDLMRLFQRAFKRAGFMLTHTQGYNPRPSVSIALPLSVGIESVCELLDFDLSTDMPPYAQIRDRLNDALPAGVRVLDVYNDGRKLKDLALLGCRISLSYDMPLQEDACEQVRGLFAQPSLNVLKRTKNGDQEQDIIPMIRFLEVSRPDEKCLMIDAIICCQNPALNPMQLVSAIKEYLPAYAPDDCICRRTEIFDAQEKIFR